MFKLLVSGCFIILISTKAIAKKCDVVKVEGADGWWPYYIVNQETKKLDGIAVRIVHKLFKDLNMKYELPSSVTPWKRKLHLIEKGKVDIVSTIYHNDERAKKYKYSIPYAEDRIKVWVKHDKKFKFETINDLKGKSVLITRGSSYGKIFDEFKKKHLKEVPIKSVKNAFHAINRGGRADFMVTSYFDGMNAFETDVKDLKGKVVPLEHNISVNGVYFIGSKTSPCTDKFELINNKLKEYKANGTLEKITQEFIKSGIK